MKKLMLLALSMMTGPAFAVCYSPLGEINAAQVNEATASGAANLLLTRPGVTLEYNGAVDGVVKAINSEGFPTKIGYTFVGPTANLVMTGVPVLTSLAPLDACTYALTINVNINSGSKINGKPASGKFVLKGTTNACTFKEKYYPVSGSICF